MSVYRIVEVDGSDEEDTLQELHELSFKDTAAQPDYSNGYWWIAYSGSEPVAFAGITQSTMGPLHGYMKRAGVLPEHRGYGLQRRLIRVRLAKAKRLGWKTVITDTTNNVSSANSLIKAGFKLFTPKPWAWSTSLYWYRYI
ncbi:GNAT family N-acetyltransferase [Nitrobacteraceae bacterium UC4449_H16]